MELTTLWIVGVLLVNLVLGSLLVLGVFAAMERRVDVGAIAGVVIGTLLIYAEATLGERMFTVTVQQMKLLVIAACLGAIIGVVGSILVVEPEL